MMEIEDQVPIFASTHTHFSDSFSRYRTCQLRSEEVGLDYFMPSTRQSFRKARSPDGQRAMNVSPSGLYFLACLTQASRLARDNICEGASGSSYMISLGSRNHSGTLPPI